MDAGYEARKLGVASMKIEGGKATSRRRRMANVSLREPAAEAEEAARTLIDAQHSAIITLRAEINRERARTEAILSSTSWKLTAPIRLAKTFVSALSGGWRATEPATTNPAESLPPDAKSDLYKAWIVQSELRLSTVADETVASEILFSVLVPIDNYDDGDRFAATLASLQAQQYRVWQLVVVPFAEHGLSAPTTLHFAVADPRVLIATDTARSRGAALHNAVALAAGAFVLPLEAGDLLAANALGRLASRLAAQPALEILYADEDFVCNGERCRPQLKPSWSPELLTAYDYFGKPTVLRRATVEAVGSFAHDVDAGCEWDLHLRMAGIDMNRPRSLRIDRLTEVLCHREASSLGRPSIDNPAVADLRQVLTQHWRRQGLLAQVATQPDGTLNARWVLDNAPLVSAIVLNKDHALLLRDCLDGLLTRTSYPFIEVIVVDNGSTDADTLALYGEAEKVGVRIVHFDQIFNYSRACNIGAAAATGDLLLFLNNDVEMIEPGWLDEMVMIGSRPGVGVVGARLVYPNGDLQHGGVVLGLRELCAHLFHGMPTADQNGWGLVGSPIVCRNYMAVTGACMLTTRIVFDRVGGFDETFTLAFSDVKMGIDAWRAGYRNVYVGQAVLVHHEGISRGTETPHADQAALARAIMAAGIEDDPYFHPAINAQSSEPGLRLDDMPSTNEVLWASIARLHPAKPSRSLDLFDDNAVMTAVNRHWHELFWLPETPPAVGDSHSVGRLIIDLLRSRSDIRVRFPKALSDGRNGAFATWLKSEGGARIGLHREAAAWIDNAYDADFASRARQLIIYSDSLRSLEQLFLLPPGRAATAGVLFAAAAQGALDLLEVWWMLLSSAEVPERELILTWQLTPAWQHSHPAGITMVGCDGLSAWIRRSCDVDEDWLDPESWPMPLTPAEQVRMAYLGNDTWRARFPNCYANGAAFCDFWGFLRSDEARLTLRARRWIADLNPKELMGWLDVEGINVLGHFSYPSGLRTSVNAIVGGLKDAGVSTELRDVRTHLGIDEPGHDQYVGSPLFDITLIHVQPEPLFDQCMQLSGLACRMPHPYRIGYWYWEFDSVPPSWDGAALQCQELWVATSFVARGLLARYNLPVHVLPPGLKLPNFASRSRQYFGLPESGFLFNFTFHMESVIERKNPLAIIAAFRSAFSRSDDAHLVIKVSGGEQHQPAISMLRAESEGLNVHIIDSTFSYAETLALIAISDAYVSLHRSEGFGLTLAEAMLLGKPTIATGYSGNLDFMNDGNSLLVNHQMVDLERDIPPYNAGLKWAEPDIDHAAALMQRLYHHRDYGQALGVLARKELIERFSPARTGRAMADRLREARLVHSGIKLKRR